MEVQVLSSRLMPIGNTYIIKDRETGEELTRIWDCMNEQAAEDHLAFARTVPHIAHKVPAEGTYTIEEWGRVTQ